MKITLPMIAYYFMLYPLEWQYRRAMEISDENIIDLYIILGVFCGTLLISTLVCIAIYCHWHKNHRYSKYSFRRLSHVFGHGPTSCGLEPSREPRRLNLFGFKGFNRSISRMYSAMRNKSGYNKIDSSINVKSRRMKLPSDNPSRICTLDGSPLIFFVVGYNFRILIPKPFRILKFRRRFLKSK